MKGSVAMPQDREENACDVCDDDDEEDEEDE